MRSRIGKGYAAVAVMAIAVTLLALSMTAPAISSTEDFSIFNTGWNGTSGLAVMTYKTGKFVPTFTIESTGTDITVSQIGLTTISPDPGSSALIIIGPTKDFTDAEGQLVGDFVRGGGKLLLADDFGTGNSLLSKMGAGSRFSGDLVMDLAFEKQPEFSVVFDLVPDPLTKNVTTLLLNYPSSVSMNVSTTSAIAYSSVASWRDSNGNKLHDPYEPRGPFPVIAREHLGAGTIILISDPSVLINGMRDDMDNQVLAENLVTEMSIERTEVFFDESHRAFFDPISVAIEITGEVSATAKAAIAVAAFVVTLWIATDMIDNAVLWLVRKARAAVIRLIRIITHPFARAKPKPERRRASVEEMVGRLSEERPEMRLGLVRYMLRERERHASALESKKD